MFLEAKQAPGAHSGGGQALNQVVVSAPGMARPVRLPPRLPRQGNLSETRAAQIRVRFQ
jgi:hypothetical protein